MQSSRRAFLKHAASLSAISIVGFEGAAALNPATLSDDEPEANAAWYDRPMRWAQLSFVEDDPGNYDLAFLARLLPEAFTPMPLARARRMRRLLPDRVPLHYRSKWLRTHGHFWGHCRGVPQTGHECRGQDGCACLSPGRL